MFGNVLFFIIISVCIILIIVLLIIQNFEKKKKRKLSALSEEENIDISEPIDNIGVPSVLYTYLPSGLTYVKTLRSFHLSQNKIKTKYDLTKEAIFALPKKESDELFSLCRKNIIAFKRIRDLEKDDKITCVDGVPAYEYLSYIYEKRDNHQYAMYTCATAIKLCACTPKSKMFMVDRIKSLSEESNLEIPDSIQELLE